MNRVRLGTRGSPLAMWQANEVALRLERAGHIVEIKQIRTSGDVRLEVALAAIGGKGLFIKELEEALVRGHIDLAVHSLKDIPSHIDDRFTLAGFLERGDPRDAWLHRDKLPFDAVPDGSRIGTSSPRRRAQLLARNRSFVVEPIRGNVGTRIRTLADGIFDGIVLAGAGLARLNRGCDVTGYFSIDEMTPAAGQGIVAIETLTGSDTIPIVRQINDERAELAARCERGVLQKFGQRLDCYSCVAVHATADNGEIKIRSFLSDYEATTPLQVVRSGHDPGKVVDEVANELMARGAIELLERGTR
jgi:hydroxymethylbilane synthase